MTLYLVLFLFGFLIAVLLLAVASLQVSELDKKVERFGQDLLARYAMPLSSLNVQATGNTPNS